MNPSTPHPEIDIHCHQFKPGQQLQVISIDIGQLQTNQNPPLSSRHHFFSLGLHPWFIHLQNAEQALLRLSNYRQAPKFIAVGECGLDKSIATDLPIQTLVFQRQAELAAQWQKPLIVHCVKAFNELIAVRKALPATPPWIIHGFVRHPQLAKQLLELGCYLSLGKALLHENSHAVAVLQSMPPERLFLETDDADVTISAIYAAAAKITGLPIAALRRQIYSNFERVFLND